MGNTFSFASARRGVKENDQRKTAEAGFEMQYVAGRKKGEGKPLFSEDKPLLQKEEESVADTHESDSTNDEDDPLLVNGIQSPNDGEEQPSNNDKPSFRRRLESLPFLGNLEDNDDEQTACDSMFLFVPNQNPPVIQNAEVSADQENNQKNADPVPAQQDQDVTVNALMEQLATLGIYAEDQEVSGQDPCAPGPSEKK